MSFLEVESAPSYSADLCGKHGRPAFENVFKASLLNAHLHNSSTAMSVFFFFLLFKILWALTQMNRNI